MPDQEYADASDVAKVTLGPAPPADFVNALLQHAYIRLKAPNAVPGLDAKVTAGLIESDTVTVVLVEMVQAVLRNPKGLRSKGTGPFTESWDMTAASGLLTVTEDHLAMLGVGPGAAFTLMPADHGLPLVSRPAPPRRAGGHGEWW